MRTVHKTCNLCEAMCGLLIEVAGSGEGLEIGRIRGDPDDPLSRGAICAKAIALREIQEDSDRLRTPVRRTATGFEPISWDEALEETSRRLAEIQQRDGDDAVGSYLGNPGAHGFGIVMYLTGLYSALSTRNKYAASSLDQNPKHASSLLLYGNFLSIPIPDIDRTDYLLILGANPVVSNGSLMSAPGMRRRLRELRARGGRLVVVDPRRCETAALADEHLFIRPGADALFLSALLHAVFQEKSLASDAPHRRVEGLRELEAALAPLSPEAVEAELGISALILRRLAREFAAAPSAVCYGRVGTCQNRFGTLNSVLIDVLNIVTGNFDRAGGAMFPRPAIDLAAIARLRGSVGTLGEWRTRVRGAPAFNGEQPAACLAEEITTPGEGQIRGMITVAGNPCLSAPNQAALDEAFASLEFYAAVDFYINETTRHADIILPPTWSLEHDNYEVLFHGFAVHNTAKYSPVVVPPDETQRHDWEILSQLALRIAEHKQSSGWKRYCLRAVRRMGWVPEPRRFLDWLLRLGPYGDGFRPWRSGLRLRDLEANPSGIDLGPLAPRIEEVLASPSAKIDVAPPIVLEELERLRAELTRAQSAAIQRDPSGVDELVLIGRRDVRTNNSWLHNVPMAVKGKERCTLQMHSHDATRRNLSAGERVQIRSRVGKVEAPLEITDDLMQGVVSLPHGWGHTGTGLRLGVAERHPGVNANVLTDDLVLEPVVGNAVLNGVPVEVSACADDGIAQESPSRLR